MQEKYSNIICSFLRAHQLISVTGLEQALEIPDGSIRQALTGARLVPEKHIFPLICHLSDYGLMLEGFSIKYDIADNTITGRKWVENLETIEEGDGFSYVTKEYRFLASDYFDLL